MTAQRTPGEGGRPLAPETVAEMGLTWRSSAHMLRLTTVAVIGLAPAALFGRPELVALVSPFVWMLAVGLSNRPPATIRVAFAVDPRRCVEGDLIEVRVRLTAPEPLDQVELRLATPSTLALVDGQDRLAVASTRQVDARWTLEARRWGRITLGTLRVAARGRGRLLDGRGACGLGGLTVFPLPATAVTPVAPAVLPRRTGDHVGRVPGEGMEFAGVREYVVGDRQRRVNWAASTRLGRLHVNQYFAERAVDLVTAVDAFSDVGEAGRTSLDLAARGATGLAQEYLRRHDRVGLVVLGGVLHWLGADVSERQYYRVVEAILDVRRDESFVEPDLARVPRKALPPGALVVLFSPLLDERSIEAARDLRERGHPLVVVDVLTAEPVPEATSRTGGLALRLWRLDREGLHHGLAEAGIPVVAWRGDEPLDAALLPFARMPPAGRRA